MRGIATRVVEDLAVVELVAAVQRRVQLDVAMLGEALDAHPEGAHHLTVADDDGSLRGGAAAQGVEHPVNAQRHFGEGFAARRSPVEGVAVALLHGLWEAPELLVGGQGVEASRVALAQVELGLPEGAGETEERGRLHGPHVLGGEVAVEARSDVVAEPFAGDAGLLAPQLGEAVLRGVAGPELGREGAVVAFLRHPVGEVTLGLAVTDQDEVLRHRHASNRTRGVSGSAPTVPWRWMARTSPRTGADPGIGQLLRDVAVFGSYQGREGRERVDVQLDELEELARTLGTTVVEHSAVAVREPHPATFFRGGAVDALAARLAELGSPAVLVNDPLSPRQQRNLEERWGVPVLDRTEVILAIFARRAVTAEGKIQVEMAQLEHLLPRLAGGWSHLERQRGGVGLRGGPGETQIEVDRRLIRQRIARLRQRLQVLERQRRTRRQARSDVPLASCALVGYTNAGKSTLLNRLTNSEVLADDLLFATLDPTSRLLSLASGRRLILTDTVGFIQALPTELVEAFNATLEEVRGAHLLALIVDVSHPECAGQLRTVLTTLAQMGCDQPTLLVANKCDRRDAAHLDTVVDGLEEIAGCRALRISATRGTGLRELRAAIDELAARVVPETRANRDNRSTEERTLPDAARDLAAS